MVEYSYLERGWVALSRAHVAGGMAGHLGAGVLAGYYFGELCPNLDSKVFRFVSADLDRIIDGEESIWFNPSKSGITIQEMFASGSRRPLVSEPAQAILQLVSSLEATMSDLRQSGHNVIFGSLALRALINHPELLSHEGVEGVVKLMNLFQNVRPGRGYYGQEEGWKLGEKVDTSEVDIPDYDSTNELAESTVDELIRTAGMRKQGFGGLFHLIDHAASLIEFWNLGFPELARAGFPAHRQHLKYLRTLPDLESELGKLERSTLFPTEPEYWHRRASSQYSAWLTHRIKSLYGFTVLTQQIEDQDKLKRAKKAFLYLMA